MLVFEFNDAAIAVWGDSALLLESPGVAILEPRGVTVGDAAHRIARLNPRATNDRYWDELSLEPLDKPTARIRSHADLAYAQLDEIRRELGDEAAEAVFAVPGSFDKEQLALLLGIARECGIRAVGLVDAAVAAATRAPLDGDLLHVDVLLHRAVLTRIRRDMQLTRTGIDSVAKAGLAALRERWIDHMADAWVRQTRFDPLHLAETEQALYDRLPGWLGELSMRDSIALEMQSGPKTHRASVSRDGLLDAVRKQYDRIAAQVREAAAEGPATVLLSARAAQLPGLADALGAASGCAAVGLAPDAVAGGVFAHVDEIRSQGDSLSFVTRLPAPAGKKNGDIPDFHKKIRNVPISPALRPTHLLHRSRAWAIGAVACEVGEGPEGLRIGRPLNGAAEPLCSIYARGPRVLLENRGGALLNEDRAGELAELKLGDRIRVGRAGDVLEIIAVVDRDGAP
ncbi:MAG TPA: hypothetical protein VM616_11090 [Gammaproteobacteria bacterium]|nr:hypothetical protein [Gammaproteobacteria bacterium]